MNEASGHDVCFLANLNLILVCRLWKCKLASVNDAFSGTALLNVNT